MNYIVYGQPVTSKLQNISFLYNVYIISLWKKVEAQHIIQFVKHNFVCLIAMQLENLHVPDHEMLSFVSFSHSNRPEGLQIIGYIFVYKFGFNYLFCTITIIFPGKFNRTIIIIENEIFVCALKK